MVATRRSIAQKVVTYRLPLPRRRFREPAKLARDCCDCSDCGDCCCCSSSCCCCCTGSLVGVASVSDLRCRPKNDMMRALWALVRGDSGVLSLPLVRSLLLGESLSVVDLFPSVAVFFPKSGSSLDLLLELLLLSSLSVASVLVDLKLRKILFISDDALDRSEMIMYFSAISSFMALQLHKLCDNIRQWLLKMSTFISNQNSSDTYFAFSSLKSFSSADMISRNRAALLDSLRKERSTKSSFALGLMDLIILVRRSLRSFLKS